MTKKIFYQVLHVSPGDYSRQDTRFNFQPTTVDENGLLWIGGGSTRVNKYDTATIFKDRKDAERAVRRSRNWKQAENKKNKKRRMAWVITPYRIIPLITV